MKFVTLGSCAVAAVLGLSAVSSQAAITVTEVMSSSGSGGTNDWFEVVNTGAAISDISTWKMDDNSFSFAASVPLAASAPDLTPSLPSNTPVIFLEATTAAPATEVAAFRTFWGGAAATAQIITYTGSSVSLSSSGDGVVLFDGSGTEQTPHMAFGAATTGVSFLNPSNTFPLTTFSSNGVGGAYTSANALHNIGSPGAVPEPTSIGMLLLGGLIPLSRRRRRA